MSGIILSTNCADPLPDPGGDNRVSGINKRPVEYLELTVPGPRYGDGSGVCGDVVGDSKHHGGADKAVYAFNREELDYWSERLGRNYPKGYFGENLTVQGLSLADTVINQRIQIGEAILEVSVPRQPCHTFAEWMGVPGWLKMFIDHGDCGAYFRVIKEGRIYPGDVMNCLAPPAHGITMRMAFQAKMGDIDLAREVVEAQCLPPHHHEQLERRIRRHE